MAASKYEIFLKVVELGSLTRAAEEFGYTQSGVSHVISSLEEEFGFPMLIRRRSGARLTPDGARVLPAIRGIVASTEQLNQLVSEINGLHAGTVRLGVFTSVAVHWLPGMIKAFQQDYPTVDFQLMNGDYHDVESWLADGSIDLGFVNLPLELDCPCIPLLEDPLLAILPKDHRLAGQKYFPLQELEKEAFIGLLESSDHDARRVMERAGIRPNIKFTTKDDYAIIAMVEQGLGISIMPELLLKGRTGQVAVKELSEPMSRTIALATPAAAQNSPCVRRFTEYVQRFLGLMPAAQHS